MKKNILCIFLSFVLLLSSCSFISDTTPESIPAITISQDYEQWTTKAKETLKSLNLDYYAPKNDFISDDSAQLSWNISYLVNGLYRAYCHSGDIEYIDAAAIILKRTYDLLKDYNKDGYLNWGTYKYSKNNKYYEEYAVHTGVYSSVAGEICNLIYADPKLSEAKTSFGITYKELADYIIDITTTHLIPAFDKHWSMLIKAYYSDDSKKKSLPHNQYLAMAVTMIEFSKLCPSKASTYLRKAEAMLANFKTFIKYNKNGSLEWNYSDALFRGDSSSSSPEDFSHGQWEARAAIKGYINGSVFNIDDISGFVKTYEKVMFRGNEARPTLSHYVDGSGDADGLIRLFIFDLSVYGSEIVKRGMTILPESNYAVHDTFRILSYHPNSPVPQSFNLTFPENHSVLNDKKAVLRWTPSIYSTHYSLSVSKNEDMSDPIVVREKIIDTSIWLSDLEKDTTYYWQVSALNTKGEKRESEKFTFSIGSSK